jgi:hypothetical protein
MLILTSRRRIIDECTLMGHMEVTVKDRKWHRGRRRALWLGVGFVVLGLLSGLFAYESVKERGVTVTRGAEAAAADRVAAPPPIDSSRPGRIETATFALG